MVQRVILMIQTNSFVTFISINPKSVCLNYAYTTTFQARLLFTESLYILTTFKLVPCPKLTATENHEQYNIYTHLMMNQSLDSKILTRSCHASLNNSDPEDASHEQEDVGEGGDCNNN